MQKIQRRDTARDGDLVNLSGHKETLQMSAMNQPEPATGRTEHEEHRHELVCVTVDGKPHEVRRGEYIVADFKKLVGVDAARELDEVVHGELKPLDDNAHIHIKGGEVFVSHVRTGGSA